MDTEDDNHTSLVIDLDDKVVSILSKCDSLSTFSLPCLTSSDISFFYSQNGLNALHLAAKEGHVDLVQELLDRGASVDSSTKVRYAISMHLTSAVVVVHVYISSPNM